VGETMAVRADGRLRARFGQEFRRMGKGDRRTRRGKLYRGSFGKTRAKDPAKKKKRAAKKK
jgi:30S ribosomal protein S31